MTELNDASVSWMNKSAAAHTGGKYPNYLQAQQAI